MKALTVGTPKELCPADPGSLWTTRDCSICEKPMWCKKSSVVEKPGLELTLCCMACVEELPTHG